jgi:septation ring formation regulator EzrA
MLAEIGLDIELVEEVRRELAQREEEARVRRIFVYVLGDLEEIELDASDTEQLLSSVEEDLKTAVNWLKMGEVECALEDIKEALQKVKEALNSTRKIEFQAEETENYIRYAYFGEPLYPDDEEGDGC